MFNSVKPFLGSVQWQNGQDLYPDTLYEQSTPAISKIDYSTGDCSKFGESPMNLLPVVFAPVNTLLQFVAKMGFTND